MNGGAVIAGFSRISVDPGIQTAAEITAGAETSQSAVLKTRWNFDLTVPSVVVVWSISSVADKILPVKQRGFREKELLWLEQHREELERLDGKWLLIEGDRLIAADEDYDKIMEMAKKEGIKVPFVFLNVPDVDAF